MRFLAILLLVLTSTICQAATPTGAANWTASGTTNSNLKGVARINSLVASNSLTLNGFDVETALAARASRDQATVNISASDIDLSSTNRVFSKSLAADTTFTFSNLANGQRWMVILTNGASWTVTWPTVTWMSGSAPVMDVGAGVVNTFVFQRQGGVTFGDVSQKAPVKLSAIEALANAAGALVNDGNGVFSYVSKQDTLTAGTGIAIGGTTIYATNVVENAQLLTDNTTNDVSIAKHGYAPKAPNDATKFLDGTGAWTVPAGGSVANPTATIVNNTAINGVATSAIRSDGAPAISTTGVFQFGRLGLGAAADAIHILTLAGGTVTADTHLLDATETWNNSGVTFTGLKLNITDTASAAASLLLDIGTGGGSYVSQFKVTKAGAVTTGGALSVNGNISTYVNGAFTWPGRSQMISVSDGTVTYRNNATTGFTGLRLGPDGATPSNILLRPGDGSGADKAGGNISLEGGISTGTGRGGNIVVKTSQTGATTGSGANAQTERIHVIPKSVSLTDNGLTTLFTLPVADTNYVGLTAVVTIYASDASVFQVQTTTITVDASAASTTITTAISPSAAQTGGVLPSASTLSSTFTAVDGGSNVLAVKVQSDSSLTTPFMQAKIVVTAINSNGTATITEQ